MWPFRVSCTISVEEEFRGGQRMCVEAPRVDDLGCLEWWWWW